IDWNDGLLVLGVAPEGAQRVGLVLAMLQARQIWAGGAGMPGLREALGLVEDGTAAKATVDRAEELARALVEGMELAGWQADAALAITEDVLGSRNETVERLLRFAAEELIPRLAATAGPAHPAAGTGGRARPCSRRRVQGASRPAGREPWL